jgi:hypothetical protein
MLIKKKRKREKCPHQKLDNNHYKIYMKPLPISRGFFMPGTGLTSFDGIPALFLKSLVFIVKLMYMKKNICLFVKKITFGKVCLGWCMI